jgi:polysaccharide deacetylase family protein (PEP-CTERM system associated)
VNGIALSIDVEPWWAGNLPRKNYEGSEDIVRPAVEKLLSLLDRKGARATFFILGRVAEQYPELVSEIASRGHEIGSHGYEHKNLSDTTREDFLSSERKTIEILSSASAERPVGFRAANYSCGQDTPWFHETLERDLGYRYSSSVFPMRTPLYGHPGAPLHPYSPNGHHGGGESQLLEFPLTVYRKSILKIPVCGGVYLRFQPLRLTVSLLKKVLEERPAVIYIHPRDICALGRIPNDIDMLSRFALFHGVRKTYKKVEGLLEAFSFKPIREVLRLSEIPPRDLPGSGLRTGLWDLRQRDQRQRA